jgi:hypothetical protein
MKYSLEISSVAQAEADVATSPGATVGARFTTIDIGGGSAL